jgi:hypothetical protein
VRRACLRGCGRGGGDGDGDTQLPARAAFEYGYSAAFLAVSVLCLIALIVMIRLIRKTPDLAPPTESATAGNRRLK